MLPNMKSKIVEVITLFLIFSFAFAVRLSLALELMR